MERIARMLFPSDYQMVWINRQISGSTVFILSRWDYAIKKQSSIVHFMTLYIERLWNQFMLTYCICKLLMGFDLKHLHIVVYITFILK